MNNLQSNRGVKIIKYVLFLLALFVSIYVVDVVAGGYLEKHILSGASRDWRDAEHNFKNTSCYTHSDKLGFEPVWGNCGNYDIYKELSEYNTTTETQKKHKILILGDSNTSQGEFDVKIEQSLIKSSGKNVSVIKIGIPSYNASQEVELLKTKLIDLKPDFVVLQFTPNDFTITPVVIKIGNEMMYLSAQGEKRFLTNEFLYKNSKLYSSYILYRLLINNSGASDSKPDSLRWEQQVEAMKLTMQDFATFVKSNNIEALVLVYPTFDKDKGKTETEEIIRILSSNDIKYIDMTLVANKFGGPENFQQPVVEGDVDTIHPNRDWDDVVSDTLIEYIEVHTKLMLN